MAFGTYVVDSLGAARNFGDDGRLENTSDGATPAFQLIRGREWATGIDVEIGDYLVPSDPDAYQFLYQVTAVGGSPVTGETEPTWPTAIDGTVADNGNTITCASRRYVEFHEDGFITRDPAVGPAIVTEDGTETYVVKGRVTRTDGPAVDAAGTLNDRFFLKGKDVTDDISELSGLAVADYLNGEYEITVTAENGSVALDPDQDTYNVGDVVELTPTADVGFSFTEWTGDIESTANPLVIGVTGDLNLTAVFTAD